mgnify:CR=1 FL=1
MIEKYVKTECGMLKYSELKAKRGIFAKARLYWFLLFATLRDLPKKKSKGSKSWLKNVLLEQHNCDQPQDKSNQSL